MGSIGVGPLRLISKTRAGLRNVNCVTLLAGVGKATRGTADWAVAKGVAGLIRLAAGLSRT